MLGSSTIICLHKHHHQCRYQNLQGKHHKHPQFHHCQCQLICVRIIYTIIYISTNTIPIDIIIKIFRAAITNISNSITVSIRLICIRIIYLIIYISESTITSISLSKSSGQLSQTSPIPSLSTSAWSVLGVLIQLSTSPQIVS